MVRSKEKNKKVNKTDKEREQKKKIFQRYKNLNSEWITLGKVI